MGTSGASLGYRSRFRPVGAVGVTVVSCRGVSYLQHDGYGDVSDPKSKGLLIISSYKELETGTVCFMDYLLAGTVQCATYLPGTTESAQYVWLNSGIYLRYCRDP